MSEPRYGGKTIIDDTVVHCKLESDYAEVNRLRKEDGANVVDAKWTGDDFCAFLQGSMTWDHLDYAKSRNFEIITLAEFKRRIGADSKSSKRAKAGVTEKHVFIAEMNGLAYEFDVINDVIGKDSVADLTVRRDAINARLRRFRDFKRRVASTRIKW